MKKVKRSQQVGRIVAQTPSAIPRGYRRKAARARRRLGSQGQLPPGSW